jgi:putative FmdB family regulatory protein
MPIYTYRCENCGVQFDRRQKFSDDPLTVCPECQEESLRKVYLPVGIVFKGSGFYSTDNHSPSGKDMRHPEESSGLDSKDSADKEKPAKKEKAISKES